MRVTGHVDSMLLHLSIELDDRHDEPYEKEAVQGLI